MGKPRVIAVTLLESVKRTFLDLSPNSVQRTSETSYSPPSARWQSWYPETPLYDEYQAAVPS